MEEMITFGQQQDVDKNLGTNLDRTSVVCEPTGDWMLGVVLACPDSSSVNHLKWNGKCLQTSLRTTSRLCLGSYALVARSHADNVIMWIGHRKERFESFQISLRWPIHIINPVDKTKLYSPPTQNHSFFRNLPPLFNIGSRLIPMRKVLEKVHGFPKQDVSSRQHCFQAILFCFVLFCFFLLFAVKQSKQISSPVTHCFTKSERNGKKD